MNKFYSIFVFLGLIGLYFLFTGYANGPATVLGSSFTGAPGEGGLKCGNCHVDPGSYGGVTTTVEVFEFGTSIPAGSSFSSCGLYDIQVTVNHGLNTPIGFGFQCVAVDMMGSSIGTFSNPQSNTKIVVLPSGVNVAEHNGISVFGQSNVFKWQWQAPCLLQGAFDVTFYSTGAAVNSNSGSTGDSGSGVSGTFILLAPVLPVELIDFTASNVDNDYHLIEWSTASEQDADYFVIEHSTNGESFTQIAEVSAAGTTIERQDYDFRFAQPNAGINYYRLKQVDLDGELEVFKIISVYQFRDLELVKVYPIPAKTTISIDVRYNETGSFDLNIMDRTGKTVLQDKVTLEAGITSIHLDLSALASGSYVLKLSNKTVLITTPILKF